MCWPDTSDNIFKPLEKILFASFNHEESSSLDLIKYEERSLWIFFSCYVRGTPQSLVLLRRTFLFIVYVCILIFVLNMLGDIMLNILCQFYSGICQNTSIKQMENK